MSKHAASPSAPHLTRRTRPSPPTRSPRTLLLAIGITGTVVAWGVLVLAAIDFGREARSGEPTAWWFLGLATVGAAASLFVALILAAKVLDLLRPAARLPGGRRAAR